MTASRGLDWSLDDLVLSPVPSNLDDLLGTNPHEEESYLMNSNSGVEVPFYQLGSFEPVEQPLNLEWETPPYRLNSPGESLSPHLTTSPEPMFGAGFFVQDESPPVNPSPARAEEEPKPSSKKRKGSPPSKQSQAKETQAKKKRIQRSKNIWEPYIAPQPPAALDWFKKEFRPEEKGGKITELAHVFRCIPSESTFFAGLNQVPPQWQEELRKLFQTNAPGKILLSQSEAKLQSFPAAAVNGHTVGHDNREWKQVHFLWRTNAYTSIPLFDTVSGVPFSSIVIIHPDGIDPSKIETKPGFISFQCPELDIDLVNDIRFTVVAKFAGDDDTIYSTTIRGIPTTSGSKKGKDPIYYKKICFYANQIGN